MGQGKDVANSRQSKNSWNLFNKENACKNMNPIKIQCNRLGSTLKCKENVFPAIYNFHKTQQVFSHSVTLVMFFLVLTCRENLRR